MVAGELGKTVTLFDLCLPGKANQRWAYSGLDSPNQCLDPRHFDAYPWPVEYVYNSRGFRDNEWPTSLQDLKNAIWCVGDSFTVGIGCPIEHSWPRILEERTEKRTINISMDGASNDWIARQACKILEEVRPTHMVVMWSYLHRRENDRKSLDLDRRLHQDYTTYQQDLTNFIANVNRVREAQGSSRLCMCTIPRAFVDPMREVFDFWRSIADASWPAAPVTDQQMADLPDYIKQEMQTKLNCWDWYLELRDRHNQFQLSLPDRTDLQALPDLIFEVEQLDWARDRQHFDINTSRTVVDRLVLDLDL